MCHFLLLLLTVTLAVYCLQPLGLLVNKYGLKGPVDKARINTLYQVVLLWETAVSSVGWATHSQASAHANMDTHAPFHSERTGALPTHTSAHTNIPFTSFHQRVRFDKVRSLASLSVSLTHTHTHTHTQSSVRNHGLVPSSGLSIIKSSELIWRNIQQALTDF